MSLSFEEVMARFLRTGYDSHVFDRFVRIGLPDEDVKKERDTYSRTRSKEDRWELLFAQAKRLGKSGLKKYSGRKADNIVREEIVDVVEDYPRIRNEIFGHTDSERNMYPAIRSYLRQLKRRGNCEEVFETYDRRDLPVGNPDFVIAKKRLLRGTTLAAIDAKATLQSLHTFYHQASRYREGFGEVYLATTNWLVIQENEGRLLEMLKGLGVGLIYVDMTADHCDMVSQSDTSNPDKETVENLLSLLR
jgi:hypothetical protein